MRKKLSVWAKLAIAAGSLLMLLIVLLGGTVSFLKWGLPRGGPVADIHIVATPARLERGKYLVEHVTACLDCHSEVDETKMFYHPVAGREGAGGRSFPGPGEVYAANITPAHLGGWSDGELLRAITAGVSSDGHTIFPIMPYANYRTMDEQDAEAIIAYIRSIKPIASEPPQTHLQFIPALFINLAPKPPAFSPRPAETNTVEYGHYMATMASCIDCHTERDAHGQMLKGREFAGGMVFKLSTGGVLRSSNITPDPQTGIGNWTSDQFIEKFKSFDNASSLKTMSAPNQMHSEMPWISYSGMKKSDLAAIYAYLQTLTPLSNKVVKFDGDSAAIQ